MLEKKKQASSYYIGIKNNTILKNLDFIPICQVRTFLFYFHLAIEEVTISLKLNLLWLNYKYCNFRKLLKDKTRQKTAWNVLSAQLTPRYYYFIFIMSLFFQQNYTKCLIYVAESKRSENMDFLYCRLRLRYSAELKESLGIFVCLRCNRPIF